MIVRLCLTVLVCCFPLSAQANESGAVPSASSEHGEHEDHPDIPIFLGLDFAPAISAEAMSIFGLHLEVEFEIDSGHHLVVAGGLDAVFPSAEGEEPENSIVPGFSAAYMRHLENVEVGGSVAIHVGIAGVETSFVVGKELTQWSDRLHGHIGLGVTWGENSDGDQDILLGPLMFGLGYRLN